MKCIPVDSYSWGGADATPGPGSSVAPDELECLRAGLGGTQAAAVVTALEEP
ncbi:MAG TPA: hypothetical protein VIZ43_04375 [Trebonia sp.]